MSTVKVKMVYCKYCKKPENKQVSPCMNCKQCKLSVHLECLLSERTPGNFSGDVFFDFTCADCSATGTEIFKRDKISWIYVLVITLNHLNKTSTGISNQGFFHRQTHISSFISNNWTCLFDTSCKRRRNFGNSFNGILSTWKDVFFESGESVINEVGWWKLANGFSPALVGYLHSEVMLWKQKDRKNSNSGLSYKLVEYNIMEDMLLKIGFKNILSSSYKIKLQKELESEDLQNENLESNTSSPKSEIQNEDSAINNRIEMTNSDIEDYFPNYLMDCDESLMINFDEMLMDFEDPSSSSNNLFTKKESLLGQYSNDHLDLNLSVDENLNTDNEIRSENMPKTMEHTNREMKPNKLKIAENYIAPPEKSLFSDNKKHSNDVPWSTNSTSNIYKQTKNLFTTEYTEIQTLNHINALCRKVHFDNVDKKLIRLRTKLALRKLKRQRHMPLFNLDSLVSKLAYYPEQDSLEMSVNNKRILDHFQFGNKSTLPQLDFALRLVSTSDTSPFISPYSGNLLKPYIWRDTETYPLWLKLMDEMKDKANKNNPSYQRESRASLDYCYVRPQHIAAINNMCEQFFWPGIDLSDTLLYPEYSCVAFYKKIVVGFAFLVPDVSYNQAYLSFLLTRPEWRSSGIASFMLYHLTQTCIDKDITLHVSASNPAIFLYQKFGFKIEEFLQEFYDKYFPPESKECKHALFLRLSRS